MVVGPKRIEEYPWIVIMQEGYRIKAKYPTHIIIIVVTINTISITHSLVMEEEEEAEEVQVLTMLL